MAAQKPGPSVLRQGERGMERTSHLPEFLWILCDDRQNEPSHVLTDTATIGRYLPPRGGTSRRETEQHPVEELS